MVQKSMRVYLRTTAAGQVSLQTAPVNLQAAGGSRQQQLTLTRARTRSSAALLSILTNLKKHRQAPVFYRYSGFSFKRALFPFSKYLRRRDTSRQRQLQRRGGGQAPIMSDLPCPSSGEQERTCNFPWGRLAHVAQGYWKTVNSAQGHFCVFLSILMYKTNKR